MYTHPYLVSLKWKPSCKKGNWTRHWEKRTVIMMWEILLYRSKFLKILEFGGLYAFVPLGAYERAKRWVVPRNSFVLISYFLPMSLCQSVKKSRLNRNCCRLFPNYFFKTVVHQCYLSSSTIARGSQTHTLFQLSLPSPTPNLSPSGSFSRKVFCTASYRITFALLFSRSLQTNVYTSNNHGVSQGSFFIHPNHHLVYFLMERPLGILAVW